ncbi:hypothetical protein ZIOFF_046062 [Zingiber officinale]|uniref:Reverse transcriptase Ty1/copia-type domain-containing protein n=1 Tax=Zingiber officinale TaxID=94328 RepID=A0A8J5FZL1_ZINOF|nr:hypothetical protein ZIOFF_046062 [Zingiber officinale]
MLPTVDQSIAHIAPSSPLLAYARLLSCMRLSPRLRLPTPAAIAGPPPPTPTPSLYAGSNPSMFGEFKEAMTKEFEMTDIGLVTYYLGIEVNQREDGSFISQAGYAREILKKFRMDNSKPINTPVECGVKLSKHDEEEKVDPTFFKSLVESLRYLTCTRPDILYAVGLVSRYMEDPTTTHLKIAKRILRYIKVCLVNCRVCEHIPPFGNLQFLKKLDLKFISDITHMGAEFHGYRGFPSLRELCLARMNNLEEWSEYHGVHEFFPKLHLLQVSDCCKLKSMPRLPRIQELVISCCNGSLLSCVGRMTSLSVLKVSQMYNMTSLPSGCIRNLTSLTELKITNCIELQSLPGDEMQRLEMLRLLTIERCYNLASFPSEVGRLSSLCSLRLLDCHCIIFQPEELVQILNLVHQFQIQICGNEVDLRGQLQYLHTIRELSIRGAHYGFTKFKIRKGIAKLSICCCDELESLMTAEPTNSLLEKLCIDGISNLTTLPDWLQHLSSLCFLQLSGCPSIILQPEELVQILNSVPKFQIQICGNRVNLFGQLQHLHTLRGLSLSGAHYGSSIYKYLERYENSELSICCCDELESLMTADAASSIVLEELYIDGISNLTTLPDWLQHLKSLCHLSIKNCSQLGTLPRGLKNLHMLETLSIINCPQLKRRYEKEIGEDWPTISHVSYVDIS